jgi:hypothetical protein
MTSTFCAVRREHLAEQEPPELLDGVLVDC